MNRKPHKTTQETKLNQEQSEENMLLKELFTSSLPISADSENNSKPEVGFEVPEVYRDSVEYFKEFFPDASDRDLVDMLKLYS